MTRPWPRVRGRAGGGGGLYSADLRSRTFHQGDTLTLPAGSGVLAMAGTGEVIHSGAFIDVTEGVEIPSGSQADARGTAIWRGRTPPP